jgi:hypothetical protein
MNIKVEWSVEAHDLGTFHSDCCSYIITDININENIKEIWSVSYSCSSTSGDKCSKCGEPLNIIGNDVAYVGQLSEWLKKQLLEKLPDHKFQGYNFSSGSKA